MHCWLGLWSSRLEGRIHQVLLRLKKEEWYFVILREVWTQLDLRSIVSLLPPPKWMKAMKQTGIQHIKSDATILKSFVCSLLFSFSLTSSIFELKTAGFTLVASLLIIDCIKSTTATLREHPTGISRRSNQQWIKTQRSSAELGTKNNSILDHHYDLQKTLGDKQYDSSNIRIYDLAPIRDRHSWPTFQVHSTN